MAVLSEDEIGRRCVAAAVALSCAHVLTIVGTDYQVYAPLSGRLQLEQIANLPLFFLVNYGTFLSPLVVIFAFRKVCVALGILAIPILTFFTLRMYYVWQFYWFGINSMARQKGDALGFFNMVFDMLSLFVAVPILLFIIGYKLIEGFQRIRGR
jgi:hypothetical protein